MKKAEITVIDGNVYWIRESDDQIREECPERYDFNREYQGYYPPCRFTACSSEGGLYLLAGIDDQGLPHLFASLMGNVWEERPLISQSPLTMFRKLQGEIFRILYEEENNQYYLICRNGQAAVMPDCPKCLRIFSFERSSAPGILLADAELISVTKMMTDSEIISDAASTSKAESVSDDFYETSRNHTCDSGHEPFLLLTWQDGKQQKIELRSLRQYRVSVSYASRLIAHGASLIDVRECADPASVGQGSADAAPAEKKSSEAAFINSVHVPLSELDDYLKDKDAGTCMIFLCRTGRLADEAAEYARAHGFRHAFSLGGSETWAHVE